MAQFSKAEQRTKQTLGIGVLLPNLFRARFLIFTHA